jgi:hypothetical protein
MANIQKRNLNAGNNAQDEAAIANFSYSQSMGGIESWRSRKTPSSSSDPRRIHRIYHQSKYAAFPLPGAGKNLAVYNNSGTVEAITFGMDNTVTALAAGAHRF